MLDLDLARAFPLTSPWVPPPQNIYDIISDSALSLSFMGDYDSCRHTGQTRGNVHYCTLAASKLSMTQGLCMPSVCTPSDIEAIFLHNLTRPDSVKDWVHQCGGEAWNATCASLFPSKPTQRKVCDAAFAGLQPILVTMFNITSFFEPAVAHCGEFKDVKWSWGAITMLVVCALLLLLTGAQFLRENYNSRELTEEEAAFFPVDNKGSINEPQPMMMGELGGKE